MMAPSPVLSFSYPPPTRHHTRASAYGWHGCPHSVRRNRVSPGIFCLLEAEQTSALGLDVLIQSSKARLSLCVRAVQMLRAHTTTKGLPTEVVAVPSHAPHITYPTGSFQKVPWCPLLRVSVFPNRALSRPLNLTFFPLQTNKQTP